MSAPRLVNLPPSDPVTPDFDVYERAPTRLQALRCWPRECFADVCFPLSRGTPNSTTTSLSGLSTTAIKDGHQGNMHPHTNRAHRSSAASDASTTTLDAERADRISRLAGLERVSTVRPESSTSCTSPPQQGNCNANPLPSGYFDGRLPHMQKERSTVGSASATGSVSGRTTWASGSDVFESDRIGDDPDDGTSSAGGFSDENASLVGFGEGASSTISGPVSTAPQRMTASLLSRQASANTSGGRSGSPSAHRSSSLSVPSSAPQQAVSMTDLDPSSLPSPTGSNTPGPMEPEPADDARMVDGMTFDPNVIDTTDRPAPPAGRNQTRRGPDPELHARMESVQHSK